MKILLAAVLLIPAVVSAQKVDTVNKQVYCGDPKPMIEALKGAKEAPVWVGDVDDQTQSRMSLWISKENNTWTLVQANERKFCVIDYGTKNLFSAELISGKGT